MFRRVIVTFSFRNRLFHNSKKLRHSAAGISEQNQSYVQCTDSIPLLYRTIGQQLKLAAQKFPNNEALVSCHERHRFTYAEVLEKVDRLAAALYQLGLEKGDRVAIWAPNCTAYYLATYAVARAGMISVGVNPAYQVPELEYSLNKVGVKAIIMAESFRTRNYYDVLKELAPELSSCIPGKLMSLKVPSLRSVIVDSGDRSYPGAFSMNDLLDLPTEQQIRNIDTLQSLICPDSGACLLLTSGTTGQPKAALLSHFGLVNNATQAALRNELDTSNHRVCVHVPLFHVFGLVFGMFSPLNYGSTVVLPSAGFKGSDSLEAINKEKCTVVYGTPTMYVDMVAESRKGDIDLHPMNLAIVGAASCSPQLLLDIQDQLCIRKVRIGYGMTETSCATFLCDRKDTTESSLETVGRIMDQMEAKVVDREGNIVPFGSPGELWIRGYGTMLGYWGDKLKTEEVLGSDRWFRTGDQFVLQPDGYGQIVGRLKEMIIRGGENIYPKEIEDVLNTIPEVLESHCIGVPDERLGEEVCAYVRVADSLEGQHFDVDRMKRFCKDKLAFFKIPKHLRIVEELPKTTSGKVQKFKLLELFLMENK